MTPATPGDEPKVPDNQVAALREMAEVIARRPPIDGSEPDPAAAVMARVLMAEQYQGTFPHPSHLREFNDVVENGAERAFALTEREQAHRHRCDEKLVDAEVSRVAAESADRRLLIVLAAVIIILGLVGAVVLTIMHLPVPAAFAGGTSALALIAASVGGVVMRRKAPNSKGASD